MPVESVTALVMVEVYPVAKAKLVDGVKVAVVPLKLTAPVTPVFPLDVLTNEKVEALNVDAFIASLKVAEMATFVPTPVALLAGVIEMIVGTVLVCVPVVNDQV